MGDGDMGCESGKPCEPEGRAGWAAQAVRRSPGEQRPAQVPVPFSPAWAAFRESQNSDKAEAEVPLQGPSAAHLGLALRERALSPRFPTVLGCCLSLLGPVLPTRTTRVFPEGVATLGIMASRLILILKGEDSAYILPKELPGPRNSTPWCGLSAAASTLHRQLGVCCQLMDANGMWSVLAVLGNCGCQFGRAIWHTFQVCL